MLSGFWIIFGSLESSFGAAGFSELSLEFSVFYIDESSLFSVKFGVRSEINSVGGVFSPILILAMTRRRVGSMHDTFEGWHHVYLFQKQRDQILLTTPVATVFLETVSYV